MKTKIIIITLSLLLFASYFCPFVLGYYVNEINFYKMWKFENKIEEEYLTPWYNFPANIVIDKDNSIVYTDYSNRFVALNLETGKEIFSIFTPHNQVFENFVVDENGIYIVQCSRDYNELFSGESNYLIKLNKETGKEIWRRQIIGDCYLFDDSDSLIIAPSCCPYLIFISKDSGETTEELILSNYFIKNRRFLRIYPTKVKERYLYWISSPVNKEENIVEIIIFDIKTHKQIKGLSINAELTEETYCKIIYVDEKNIIIEKFADILCWYEPSELICFNFEKGEIAWKRIFSEENHIRSVFVSDVNKNAYYLICKSEVIVILNKSTGELIDELKIVQDEISKILSNFKYYPLNVTTWNEYAWFRFEHTIFMINLKTKKLVFKIWEGEEYSYSDISDGISLSSIFPPIVISENQKDEIDLLLPLGNQLIRGTFFIRKLPFSIFTSPSSKTIKMGKEKLMFN